MSSLFNKSLVPLIAPALKLAGCFSVALTAGAYSQDELFQNLTVSDSAEIAVLKSAFDLIKDLSGGEIVGAAKELLAKYDLTINGDFEEAFHSAIEQALKNIEKSYFSNCVLAKDERLNCKLFFENLKSVLVSTPVTEADVEYYVVNRQKFLQNFSNFSQLTGFDSTLPGELMEFIEKSFDSTLRHELLKKLNTNPKAQTVYVISLLDLNVRYGAKNVETLASLEKCLWDLTINIASVQEQGNRIVHLLQVIQEELRKQGVDNRVMFREILDNLRKSAHQPKLYDYKSFQNNDNKADRYHYRSAYTSFIAREIEIEQLHTFILPDPMAKFRWWTIIGRGGIGKSRLAQEVSLTFNALGNYYCGFLAEEETLIERRTFWQAWQPKCYTLLIIDYVSTRADDIHALIRILTNRATELDYSVRILLLERSIDAPWWLTINTNETRLHKYGDQPLVVSPLTDDERWHIIEEVYKKASYERRKTGENVSGSLPDKAITLKELNELDGFDRPLFAFLVAIALSDGETIRDWRVHDLLRHIINEHERKRWWNRDVSSEDQRAYERLLALATITRGITLTDWRFMAKQVNGLPDPSNYDLAILNRLGEFTSENLYLRAVEPDILGEFFVAEVLKDWGRLYDDGTNIQSLINNCWVIGPFDTWSFAERLLIDFPDSSCLPQFWADLTNHTSLGAAVAWACFQYNLSHPNLSSRRPTELLHKPFFAIDRIRMWPELASNTFIALQQAKVANQLSSHFSKVNGTIAELFFLSIVDLRTEHDFGADPQIALRQAMAACNLVIAFGKTDLAQAERYFEIIVDLRTEHSLGSDLSITRHQVLAAYVLANFFGKVDLAKAETYFRAIVHLRSDKCLAADPQVALQQAMAAFNLMIDFGQTNLERAEWYYRTIVKLRKRHDLASDPQIALQQVMAGTNLVINFGSRNLAKAKRYYEDILHVRTRQGFTTNLQIARRQVVAAYHLVKDFGKSDLVQAERYFQDIVNLRAESGLSTDPNMAICQTIAAHNLAVDFGKADEARAERYLQLNVDLQLEHSPEVSPEIARRQEALQEFLPRLKHLRQLLEPTTDARHEISDE